MCVIIYKPANVVIRRKTLLKCFRANNHGAGFLFKTGSGMVIEKGFMTFKALWAAIKPYQECEGFVHCRIASRGPKTSDFTHPFEVKEGQYLFHNGTITGLGDEVTSDTYELAQALKGGMFEEQCGILDNLADYGYGKFALVTENDFDIFGEWSDYQNLKFSNMHWNVKPVKKVKYNWVMNDNRSYQILCKNCKQPTSYKKWMCVNCGEIT